MNGTRRQRGKGSGAMRERGKGRWQITFEVSADPSTGRRRQRSVTVRGTKKQAEAKLREILSSLERGIYTEPSKVTVEEFLCRWVKDHRLQVRSRTGEEYAAIIERD